MQAVRVGVVMGGVSSGREMSLQSGAAVSATLQQLGYDVVRIDLGSGSSALATLAGTPVDVAFLALQGAQGEDGVVQGILEMLGIPYTGSGVLGSALATDRLKSKELFRLHNVPTPVYYELTKAQAGELRELHGSFGFPVTVRPRREAGVGVFQATSPGELSAAVDYALQYDDSVLIERSVRGREVAVGLLDGEVLGAVEIAASESPDGAALEGFSLEPTRLRGLLNLAERAASALDVRGPALVHLLVTENANEYVLEVDTLPELVPASPWVRIAAAAGYEFPALCEAVLRSARLDSSCVRPALASTVFPPEMGVLPSADPWTEEGSFDFGDYAVVAGGRRGRSRSSQRSA